MLLCEARNLCKGPCLLQAQPPAQALLRRSDRLRSGRRAAALLAQLAEAAQTPVIPLAPPRPARWALAALADDAAQLDADAGGLATEAAAPGRNQGAEPGLGFRRREPGEPAAGASNAVPLPAAKRELGLGFRRRGASGGRAGGRGAAGGAAGAPAAAVAYLALPWLALAAGQLGAHAGRSPQSSV